MNWIQIGSLLIGVLLGATVLKGAIPLFYRNWLKVRFWLRHGRQGRRILFVYSDSSNWKAYMETHILPRIQAHAIILNWSKRREWGNRLALESNLFNHWAGPDPFVPVAFLFSPLGKVQTFRLWRLSENSRHGKAGVSREAERALLDTLKRLSSK